MSISEKTATWIGTQNGIITNISEEKDARTLELAAAVDQGLLKIGNLTKELDAANRAYAEHLLDPQMHPPAPSYATKFGLGGGNVPRTGVELDRRYYGPGDLAKAIKDTTANETKGIVSWNSFKCPKSWGDMALGLGDDWAKGLFKSLSEAVKPVVDDPDDVDEVWISIHHEPEGDFDEDDWRVMQDRLSHFVPEPLTGPLKFYLTTTGWGQEFNTQRVAQEVDWETNLFPHGAPIYGIGYDAPYNTYGMMVDEVTGVKKMNNSWTDPHVYVDALAKRGVQFGVEVAIGEWGYSNEAFVKDKTWATKVLDRAITNPHKRLRGVAYFDSLYNSQKSWTLGAANSLKRKHLMAEMTSRMSAK